MKAKFLNARSVLGTLCLVAFMAVFNASCEKDLYDEGIQNSKRFVVTTMKTDKLDVSISNRLKQKINDFNRIKESSAARAEYDSIYEFYVDAEEVRVIIDSGKTSYTFAGYKMTDEMVRNVVIAEKSDGSWGTYVVDYEFTADQFKSMTEEQMHMIDPKITEIILHEGKIEYQVICDIHIAQGEIAGTSSWGTQAPLYETVWVVSYNNCHLEAYGEETDGFPTPTAPPYSYTHTGGGGHGSGITTPWVMSPKQIREREFRNELTEEQQECLTKMPEELEDQMFEFLEATDFVDDGEGLTLANAQYSPESIYFAQQVIEAACEDDDVEVDFEKRIIYEIEQPCQRQIVKDVMNLSTPLTNMIRDAYDGNVANVKVINGEVNDNNPVGTSPQYYSANGSNFIITIKFDNDYLVHATDLSIAATTLHEMVHAYLINLYLMGTMQSTDMEYGTLMNAFTNFYNNPNQSNYDATDEEIHNVMEIFIDKMTNALYAYAQSKNMDDVTLEYCKSIVWGQMNDTDLFESQLTQNEQILYQNTAYVEQENDSTTYVGAPKGMPCTN
ncbi:hypothetical protein HUK80_10635 [Flavobacterium sp. MAH-1]|uniref:Uncharacterized protein n=1 Tax=Flavobacterium agri TaxID=2743471 RepID=A0A7Y8Y2J6_9FLAO|nr:hypothetical protein [Flavobacterium agri]NUY81354.1 hypothetical protein [Flavobacterium agri]NYA71378.1 hypothetical protein [Flavobacterium agri]